MNAGDTSVNEVDQVPASFFFFFVRNVAGVKSGVKKHDLVRGGRDSETDGRIFAKKEWAQERDERNEYKP